MIANWLALRLRRREAAAATAGRTEPNETGDSAARAARFSRRGALVHLAGGALLSLAGGYAIAWEGRRRLAHVALVEFVDNEHSIRNPHQHAEQLLTRLHKAARKQGFAKAGGLVFDLLPPDHFIQTVDETDRALAEALLRQDREFFQNPAAVEKLIALFGQYQDDLDAQYVTWFAERQAPEIPPWRWRGHSGGLLAPLERACREKNVPLRRIDQDWVQWQLRFVYEYAWQGALEALNRRDFVQFVRFLYEHHGALGQHQAMREERVARLRASLRDRPPEPGGWRAGFVYVQQPSFTALASYLASSRLNEETPIEEGVRLGTLYVVEELLRRGRLAKAGDSAEALAFARAAVARIGSPQILAWWSKRSEGGGPAEILQSFSRDGLLDIRQIESDNLLILGRLSNDTPAAPQ